MKGTSKSCTFFFLMHLQVCIYLYAYLHTVIFYLQCLQMLLSTTAPGLGPGLSTVTEETSSLCSEKSSVYCREMCSFFFFKSCMSKCLLDVNKNRTYRWLPNSGIGMQIS